MPRAARRALAWAAVVGLTAAFVTDAGPRFGARPRPARAIHGIGGITLAVESEDSIIVIPVDARPEETEETSAITVLPPEPPEDFDGRVVQPGAAAAAADPLLDAAGFWGMLEPHTDHLSDEDRANLRAVIDVLVAKADVAARAFPAESGLALLELDRTEVVLAVLEGLNSAKSLLELRCDAATAAAAMLSQAALTAASPTWPASVPGYFCAVVDGLLCESRRLSEVPDALLAARELDESSAEAVRYAMLSGTSDPRALLVLLAATTQLLRRSASLPRGEQRSIALAAVQLYAPLAHSVGVARTFPDLEVLAYTALFPDSFARLRSWYAMVWADAPALQQRLQRQLLEALQAAPSLEGLLEWVEVSGRVKRVESTFRKLLRDRSRRAEGVQDIIALRAILTPVGDAPLQLGALMARPSDAADDDAIIVVNDDDDDDAEAAEAVGSPLGALTVRSGAQLSEAGAEALLCYIAYKHVRRLSFWREVPGRFKDFVRSPKPNGYQSIHTNLRLQDGSGRIVEVQLRTAAMHERAERGSAAHHLYKGGLGASSAAQRELGHMATAAVAALLPAANEVGDGG